MIVRRRLDDVSPELTEAQKLQLERASKMPIIIDDDCPEITPEMAKNAYHPNLHMLKNIV